MATTSAVRTVEAIMQEAEAPQALRDFIINSCSLTKVPNLHAYVIKGQYEQEWKDIIEGAFPLVQSREATKITIIIFTPNHHQTHIHEKFGYAPFGRGLPFPPVHTGTRSKSTRYFGLGWSGWRETNGLRLNGRP